METKTIQVYKYEELSDDAKVNALDNHNEHNDYYFLEDDLNEYLKELLEENKIKSDDVKLYYSLSHCQGDGVCFVGNFEYKGININVRHNNGHYYHKNSVSVEAEEIEDSDDDLKNDLSEIVREEAEKEFINLYDDICDKIEKSGYEIIEYEDSEENFKELCDANGYTFRENGEMENI